MIPPLSLNGKIITPEAIGIGNIPREITLYEKKILEFCRDWLAGRETFTISTSGSTGIPKSITLAASKMRISAAMTLNALGIGPGDRSLICLNADYIGGKMMLVRSLERSLAMTIVDPASNPLKSFSADHRFDFTALVPLQAATILQESPEKKVILDRMKGILIGGAALDVQLETLLQTVRAPVYHTFGMTETLSHIALRRINGSEKQDYFQILENISISRDERDCLVISSPFSEAPLVTNDVVEIVDDRKFRWLGRKDFVINSGGIKIHPEKIERCIEALFLKLQISNRFFITGLPDPALGEALSLVVEGPIQDKSISEMLRPALLQQLSKYEIPRSIHCLDRFAETGSGKIDRNKTAALIPKR